jgi:hypothetical protein
MDNSFVKGLILAVIGKQQGLENVTLIHSQVLVKFINIIQILFVLIKISKPKI